MATDYAGFIATVEREADVPHDQAERAVAATLETLGERISGGEAHDLAGHLPPELRRLVDRDAGHDPQPLSAGEFFQRVQVRERVPIFDAQDHVRAVFAALRQAVGPEEIADLASELPRELEMLLFGEPPLEDLDEGAAGSAPSSAQDFVARVARRTARDEEGAWRAVDAVLELLAFRLAAGETDDLEQRLPPELHAPLERGKAEKPTPSAHWLPLKQWLLAVAEREGVSRAEARLHARAVFATLAEAIGDDELEDVVAQLPSEFRALFPRRRA
jgi:uncharacterized protein (DUF2267 family)